MLHVASYALLDNMVRLVGVELSYVVGIQLGVGRRIVRVGDEHLRQQTSITVPRTLRIWQRWLVKRLRLIHDDGVVVLCGGIPEIG